MLLNPTQKGEENLAEVDTDPEDPTNTNNPGEVNEETVDVDVMEGASSSSTDCQRVK